METREMTCIVCPMGCRLSVKREGNEITVTGNTCPRGDKYARQEFTNPMRTVTSSVFVRGGKMPLCSVKTRDTISKASIPERQRDTRMRDRRAGQDSDVVIRDICGSGVDLVARAMCRARNDVLACCD